MRKEIVNVTTAPKSGCERALAELRLEELESEEQQLGVKRQKLDTRR